MNCNKCVYMPGHPELDPNNAEGMIAMDCVDCGGVSFCSKDCMEAATQSGVHAVQQCNEFQLLDQCYAVIDQIQAASASAPASASGSALGIEKEEEGAKDVIENKDDNEPGQWIQGKPIWLPGVFTPSLPPAPSSPAAAASNVPDASNNVDPSSQLISSITLGHKPEPVTLLPPSLSSSSSSFQASSEERSPITNAWDAYFHAVQRSPDWSNAERAIATHSLSLPATIAYAVSSAPALNKKIREGTLAT